MLLRTKKEYEDTLDQLIESHKYQEALDYLDKLDQKITDKVWVNFNKGLIYNDVSLPHLAIAYFLNANIQLPNDLRILSEIGWTYNRLEEFENAIRYLDKANELGREDYWIYAEIAYSYLGLNLKEEAIIYLKNALEFIEDDPWALTWLANTYKELLELEKANEIYRYLYMLKSDDMENIQSLILTNEMTQNFDGHLECLEYLLELDPENEFAYLHLGTYYNLIEEPTQAIDFLSLINQPNVEVLIELGYAHKQLGDYEQAIDFYLQAYEQFKESIFLVSELAYLYGVKQNYQQKLFFLNEASRLGREDLWIYSHYIRLYLFDLNDDVKAKYYLDLAMLLDQNDEEILFLYVEYEYKRKQYLDAQKYINDILENRLKCSVDLKIPDANFNSFTKIDLENIERIYEFSEGLAYIENDSASGFINSKGELVIDFKLDLDTTSRKDTYMFKNGKAIVTKDGMYGVINQFGNYEIEPIYNDIYIKDDNYYLTIENHSILKSEDHEYHFNQEVKVMSENLIPVKVENQWGYMDVNKNIIIQPEYDEVYDFKEGIARIKHNHKYGYINKNNEIILPIIYENGYDVKNQQIIVKQNGFYGIIDLHGNIVLDFVYDEIDEMYNDCCIIKKDHKVGCYFKNGTIIEPQYDQMLPFFEGMSRVKVGEYYGAINQHNQIIVPCIYDTMTIYKGGIMIVGIGYRYGYMDIQGELLTPIMFQTATLPIDHVMSVSFDNDFYLINLNKAGDLNE